MNQNNDLQAFRLRSAGAAIADGYRLYMGNFRRLFRASWPMAIGYAVATCLFLSIGISLAPTVTIMQLMNVDPTVAIRSLGLLPIYQALATLLLFLATVGMSSYAFAAMDEHLSSGAITVPAKWYGRISWRMLWRTLVASVCFLLVFVVLQAITIALGWAGSHYLSPTAGISLFALLQLLVLATFVPFGYGGMKYMLTPKASFFPTLSATYTIGLRHWGALFVVMLITAIITTMLGYATELPAVILGMANMSSQMGTLQGDPAGMPGYMGWMTIVVLSLAGFIQAYIQLTALFPFYYLYGSIETEEGEKSALQLPKEQ